MGSIFNYENGYIQIINKIVDCVFVNLLWLLFSIPLFTIGASTTALYYTVNKVICNNRSYVWKEFWNSFRTNSKQSTIVWSLLVVIYGLGIVNSYVGYQLLMAGTLPKGIFVFIIVLMLMVTAWVNYLFPYIARFQNTTKAILKNAVYISVANIGWSILVLFMLLVSAFVCWLIPITTICVPVIYMVLASKIFEHIFQKYMTTEDLE